MKRKTSMKRHASGFTALTIALCAGMASAGDPEFDRDFGFDFVTITDVGNIPYPNRVHPGSMLNRGSVDYEYRISRLELTSGQYLEFFNIFLSNDPAEFFTLLPGESSLFWVAPGVPLRYEAGLTDPSSAGVQLDWHLAAMFCNWMHNGQSTEWESLLDGAYDVSTFGDRDPDTGSYPDQSAHHPDARYWIPTLDEHLKAVYYDPDKNGNGPGWWEYGHSSDKPIVYGLPGIGEVAREVPFELLSPLFGLGVRPGTIPLGIYPDVQSPWGLLDTLGGNGEWLEDWETEDDGWTRDRLVRPGSNTNFWSGDFDPVWTLWSDSPGTNRNGLRIASAVPHPADLDRNWRVNWFDVGYFLDRYFAGDLEVDLDESGELGIDDVWVFLELIQ